MVTLFISCKNQDSEEKITNESNQIHGRLEVSQNNQDKTDLYYILKEKDSLMFELSYNQLDTSILDKLATDNLEFHHNQGGATYTKKGFIISKRKYTSFSYA